MAEKKKAFSLAEAMRDTIGSASVTNMASGDHFVDVNKMDDDEITNRILQLKIDAGNAILEIGRWLTVMKERKEHGEWLAWLEQVDIHERAAQRYIRLYQGYSANPTALSDLGPTKALTLLALPPKEREEFMQEHNIVDMTSRQLDEAIKRQTELEQERDEARAALDTALADVKKAEEYAAGLQADMSTMEVERDVAKARVKELEDLPKDVYQDEAAIKKAADEARAAADAEWKGKFDDKLKSAVDEAVDVTNEEWQKKLNEVEEKLAKAEERAKKATAKAKTAGEAVSNEVEQLRTQLEAAKREQAKTAIAGDADLAAFQLLFEQVQADVNKMRGLLLKVRGREDSDLGEKLAKALLALADAVKESAS